MYRLFLKKMYALSINPRLHRNYAMSKEPRILFASFQFLVLDTVHLRLTQPFCRTLQISQRTVWKKCRGAKTNKAMVEGD